MFILYAVALGVIVGLVAGGRPAGLASIDIRWPGLIAGGLLAQVILFSGPVAARVDALGPLAGPALYLASTVAVAAAVLRNWSIPGIPLVVAGAACNLVAVLANGGYMPAAPGALVASGKAAPVIYSNSSVVPDPVLWPLTDLFALPSSLPAANVFSVGDVLIGLGVATVIVVAMRRPAVTRGGGDGSGGDVTDGAGVPDAGGAAAH
jgi:hypothetical protein